MSDLNSRPPADRAERLAIIREFVAERLFRQPEEVVAESRLVLDLGADSLDFIDFHFQLENRFGIHLPDGEFFDSTYRSVEADGLLTPEALQRFQRYIPELNSTLEPGRVFFYDVVNHLTVESLLRVVEKHLPMPAADGPSSAHR